MMLSVIAAFWLAPGVAPLPHGFRNGGESCAKRGLHQPPHNDCPRTSWRCRAVFARVWRKPFFHLPKTFSIPCCRNFRRVFKRIIMRNMRNGERESPKRRNTEIDTAATASFHKAALDNRVQERMDEVLREVENTGEQTERLYELDLDRSD